MNEFAATLAAKQRLFSLLLRAIKYFVIFFCNFVLEDRLQDTENAAIYVFHNNDIQKESLKLCTFQESIHPIKKALFHSLCK